MILIKNANITTMTGKVYNNGFIICEGTLIKDIGDMSVCTYMDKMYESDGELNVIDASGKRVYPGLIDPHCHVGMQEDGVAGEGDDLNEETDPITPHLKAVDGIYYMDRSFRDACEAGVTTCVTGPGSANVIGGVFAAVKTDNSDISRMVLKENTAMKFAFGQNPKITYGERKTTPATRMATVALIREALNISSEYRDNIIKYNKQPEDNEKPEYDIKKEALLPVLDSKLRVKSHAHRADDIITAVKMSKEYGYDVTIEHCTEGHLITDYLVRTNAKVICGPIILERCKSELKNHTVKTPGLLANAGITTAIMTDHPCVPIQYLSLSAMLAVKNGMKYDDALKAITITAAELTGISDRVGSLEPGKDADIIISDGDILDLKTNILCTIINGKIAYERN